MTGKSSEEQADTSWLLVRFLEGVGSVDIVVGLEETTGGAKTDGMGCIKQVTSLMCWVDT